MKGEAIDSPLSLPTIFRARRADMEDDPICVASEAARSGAEPGMLVWSPSPDRADCAIVLAPEMPLSEALRVAYVTLLAIGDTLGALMPPGVPLVFGWPDRIILNGLAAGGVRFAWAERTQVNEVPGWMVAGIAIWIAPDDRAGGAATGSTSLATEGCGEITAREIVESFSRHFLYWMDRWLEDGFEPVRSAWLSRAANYGPNANMELGGPWSNRRLIRLEDAGDIVYGDSRGERKMQLSDALRKPSWLDVI